MKKLAVISTLAISISGCSSESTDLPKGSTTNQPVVSVEPTPRLTSQPKVNPTKEPKAPQSLKGVETPSEREGLSTPLPSSPSLKLLNNKEMKDLSYFLFDDSGVQLKQEVMDIVNELKVTRKQYISVSVPNSGLAESSSYSVLANGNITEDVSGAYIGNYKTDLKANDIGVMGAIRETDYGINLAKVSPTRDIDFTTYKTNMGTFTLDLVNDTVLKDGELLSTIPQFCSNGNCYDYYKELSTILGRKSEYENYDISLLILTADFKSNTPSLVSIAHMGKGVDYDARITGVTKDTISFKLYDPIIGGQGVLTFNKDRAITVTWDKPLSGELAAEAPQLKGVFKPVKFN